MNGYSSDEEFILNQPITHFQSLKGMMPPQVNAKIKKAMKKSESSITFEGRKIPVKVVGREWIEESRRLFQLYNKVLETPTDYLPVVAYRVYFAKYTTGFPNFYKSYLDSEHLYKAVHSYMFNCGYQYGIDSMKNDVKYAYHILIDKKRTLHYATIYASNHKRKQYSSFEDFYNLYTCRFRSRYSEDETDKIYDSLKITFFCGSWLAEKNIALQQKDEIIKRYTEKYGTPTYKTVQEYAVQETKRMISSSKYKAKYPPELRLKIVSEYRVYSKNKNCSALAEKYNIPLGAVHSWVYAAYGYSD